MIYGNLRSSYSPTGREYVTRWNPNEVPLVSSGSPLAGLGGSPSPLANALLGTPPQTTGLGGAGAMGDGDGRSQGGQTGVGSSADATPNTGPGLSLGDMMPSKADAASFVGGALGSAIGGPVGGAIGGFGAGQAAGQGIGRGVGSTAGGALGFAVAGPVGSIIGSKLGSMLGSQFDSPNYDSYGGQGAAVGEAARNGTAEQVGPATPVGEVTSEPLGGYGGGMGNDGSPGGPGSGPGGEGMGNGGNAWAKGGHVTKDRLIGPDAPGPDDGYGALDDGEFVIRQAAAGKIGPDILAKLNSGKFSRGRLAKALMGR